MRGRSPITIASIVIAILLALFLVFLVFYRGYVFTTSGVKGVSSIGARNLKPGFGIEVVSNKGTWDMSVYLCKDKESCEVSLDSGLRWSTIGGGITPKKTVIIESQESWKDYKYVKVFVKPGWGSVNREFKASSENVPLEARIESIKSAGQQFQTVIFSSFQIMSDFYKVVR